MALPTEKAMACSASPSTMCKIQAYSLMNVLDLFHSTHLDIRDAMQVI